MTNELVPYERIENKIYLIRGQKVMIDMDLADLYGVETKYLNRQVKRNTERFPEDFMFQLTIEEAEASRCQIGTLNDQDEGNDLKCQNGTSNLRSQIATLKRGENIKYLPFAFTEHGILMLSSVLNSPRAIDVNIQIMRTFLKLRQIMAGNKEFAKKLELLEKRVLKHDGDIRGLVRDIRKMSMLTASKGIGFLK
jgi:hypothetical protein